MSIKYLAAWMHEWDRVLVKGVGVGVSVFVYIESLKKMSRCQGEVAKGGAEKAIQKSRTDWN